MVVVKLLERKNVIRLFGLALTAAPFFNVLISMGIRSNAANRWSFEFFWKVVSTSSNFDKALYLASLVIGLVMMSGARAAWKWVLVLLGGVIINQTLNLGQNFRANWMSGPFFLVNVSIFLFILDQLVWKDQRTDRSQSSASPRPETGPAAITVKTPPSAEATLLTQIPADFSTKPVLKVVPSVSADASPLQKVLSPPRSPKKVVVHFEGLGPWAQLMGVNQSGIQLRQLLPPPEAIHSQMVELVFSDHTCLRLRLEKQLGQEYFFSFVDLTPDRVRGLNSWLQKTTA